MKRLFHKAPPFPTSLSYVSLLPIFFCCLSRISVVLSLLSAMFLGLECWILKKCLMYTCLGSDYIQWYID